MTNPVPLKKKANNTLEINKYVFMNTVNEQKGKKWKEG